MKSVYCYLFLSITVYIAPVVKANIFHGFQRPCRDFSPECLRRSLQEVLPAFADGIPELGIPPLDPYKVENLNFDLPGGISLVIKEGYVKGLRKSHVESVRNTGGDQYEVVFRCNLDMTGKYQTKGEFMLFNIDSEGKSKIKTSNVKVTFNFRIVPITKADGNQYLQIQDFRASREYDGRVTFDLKNLFKGNPEISKIVLKLLNENWRSVVQEFGGPFFEYGVKAILSNITKVLDMIPLNQLEAI